MTACQINANGIAWCAISRSTGCPKNRKFRHVCEHCDTSARRAACIYAAKHVDILTRDQLQIISDAIDGVVADDVHALDRARSLIDRKPDCLSGTGPATNKMRPIDRAASAGS